MALRLDYVFAAFALLVSWLVTTTWIPTIRFLPHAFLAGGAAVSVTFLYIIFTVSKASRLPVQNAYPAVSNLGFTSHQSWQKETISLRCRGVYRPGPLFKAFPLFSKSLEHLLDLITRDFVRSWYGKISSGHAFPDEVDRALRKALQEIGQHLSGLDLVLLMVTRVMPIINAHLKNFSDAERVVRGRNGTKQVTQTEELDVAIAAKYRDGHVHAAASLAASKTTSPQQKHLRKLVGEILQKVLPDNMSTSSSVFVLIQEVATCAVLLPVVRLLSDPDTINQLIEGYGQRVLHERKTVRKLRAALDEHATVSGKTSSTFGTLRLGPDDNERAFEKFIRNIRQCGALVEAKRLRSEVVRQLKREAGVATSDSTYVRRLEVGKKLLDQRVVQLSQQTLTRTESVTSVPHNLGNPRETYALRQVLYDASGLSYFMEYMDRQKRMVFVQFWIVVDGFRNPLDPLDVESSQQGRSWSQTERDDLRQISEAYLWRPELKVPQTSQNAVKAFLSAGKAASYAQFLSAQQAVFEAQANIYDEMDRQHFPRFRASDLFYKWITSDKDPSVESISASSVKEAALKPPLLNRTQSGLSETASSKRPELHRAIASSSNLSAEFSKPERLQPVRRSLDERNGRNPLFDDDYDTDPLANSVQSLESGGSPANGDRGAAEDAVQAALDSLVDQEPDRNSLFSERSNTRSHEVDSERGSFDVFRPQQAQQQDADGSKPSLASLGLLGTPSRRTVFSEGDLFGEDEKLWEEERGTSESQEPNEQDEIHEAAPGDLGLAELIQRLTMEIDKLEAERAIVESLTSKAELTNNTAELRILRKSKASLDREIRRKELQRQQYIVQESDNTLYGRATLSIKNIMVGTEPDGHEFALYVIEVQRPGNEKMPGASWAITRRYSEFHDLLKRLRRRFPAVRDMDFPRRQVVLTLQKDFLKKRRAALEKFLQELLTMPAVCRSIEFRAFLSQQAIRPLDASEAPQLDRRDLVTRIYNSVTDGMEEFLGNMPVLDQLSLAGQNLISAATSASVSVEQQRDGSTAVAGSGLIDDPTTAAEAQAEISAFGGTAVPTAQQEAVTFIQPIADAFVELFQLNASHNWLRGRAVVVVLQQLLGGTIERKVREAFRTAIAEPQLASYIELVQTAMWPDGQLRGSPPVRTARERMQSRKEAEAVLGTLLPDLAGGVVGRSNAANAGKRIATTLNNERLNAHLVYSVLDEVVDCVFRVKAGR